MIALGIDPDLHTTGCALVEWHDGGLRALQTWIVRVADKFKGEEAEQKMILAIVADFHARMLGPLMKDSWLGNPPELACVEGQEIYLRSVARPNDQLRIAHVAGAAAALCAYAGLKFSIPLPKRWKGQVPKIIHHARIRNKLAWPIEAAVGWGTILPSHQTHVMDAVGLAQWALFEHDPQIRKTMVKA